LASPTGHNLATQEVGRAQETGDKGVGWPHVEVLGGADLGDPPGAHDHDVVGHGQRLSAIVRDVIFCS